jgi:hypothetical protein
MRAAAEFGVWSEAGTRYFYTVFLFICLIGLKQKSAVRGPGVWVSRALRCCNCAMGQLRVFRPSLCNKAHGVREAENLKRKENEKK